MQVSLNSQIRYNGVVYSSVDELPAQIREKVQRAVADETCISVPLSHSHVTINGHTMLIDDMPMAERRLLDDSLHAVLRPATHLTDLAAPRTGTTLAALVGVIAGLLIMLWKLGFVG